MPRKYAVLRQFIADLDRLLTEAEIAFTELRAKTAPTQPEILALFRPIHNLKGICGMVEESKFLVRAFHQFEDSLPPLVQVRPPKGKSKTDWIPAGEIIFRMGREVERLIRMKLELWRRLGAHENESRGLVVSFHDSDTVEKVWIPVTSLVGLTEHTEATLIHSDSSIGDPEASEEVLLIEGTEGVVALYFTEIISNCTRLDAVQNGVPRSFKDWWNSRAKRAA